MLKTRTSLWIQPASWFYRLMRQRKVKVHYSDQVRTSMRAYEMVVSQAFLKHGEVFSLDKMLYGIAVGSANDCCVVVAEHIGGTEAKYQRATRS